MRKSVLEFAEPARRAEVLALSLLVLAALIVRLPGLTESLWYDELWSTRVILGNLGDTLRVAVGDIHPPLYTVLMFVWTRLFGDSELSVRVIPLVAGLSTIALMPALGARLSTRNAGWVAAAFLAMSPVHIWYSQEARPYSLTILVTVVLVLAWFRLYDQSAPRWLPVAFILLSVALAQLHYFAIAVPAVLVACAIWRRRRIKVTVAGLALSVLGVAALLGAKLLMGVLQTDAGYLGVFTLGDAGDLLLNWFTLGGSLRPGDPESSGATRVAGYGMMGLVTALLAVWLVMGWKRLDRLSLSAHLLLMLAVPCVLFTLNVLGQRHYYIERSALPALPFFLLAVATGATLISNGTLRRLTLGTAMVGSGLVLAAFRSKPDEFTVYKPNPDWRTASVEIGNARIGTTGRLTVLSTTPLSELRYYMPGVAECAWPPPPAQPRSRDEPTSFAGRMARRFARSPMLTCGADGSASIRLYEVDDGTPQWVDRVRAFEAGTRVFLIANDYWRGQTPALLSALRSSGRSLRLVARAKGLEVFSLD